MIEGILTFIAGVFAGATAISLAAAAKRADLEAELLRLRDER